MAIEVKRSGEVIVRLPKKTSDSAALSFVAKNEKWIADTLARMEAKREAHPEPTAEEEKLLRTLAREILPAKTEYFSRIMGVTPTSVRITSAKTRFGSCSAKNGICYSWRLMAYDERAIDYVVVHELAHIRFHDHSKKFYAFVGSILPDWKQRSDILKK